MNKTLTRNLLVIQALSWIIGGGLPSPEKEPAGENGDKK